MREPRIIQRMKNVYLDRCSNIECDNEADPDTDDTYRWISLQWNPRGGGRGGAELFCSWPCVAEWAAGAPAPELVSSPEAQPRARRDQLPKIEA